MLYERTSDPNTIPTKIIIFGIGNNAECAYYYLTNDTNCEVVAFTLEKEYINQETKFDLPIVAFEDIENKYSTDEYMLFAPCIGTNLNRFRERIFKQGKEKGIHFTRISVAKQVFLQKILVKIVLFLKIIPYNLMSKL